MRTPRKDMFVNIVTIIWLVTNLVVYLITRDLYDVSVSNLGFFVFIGLTLKNKKIMNWLNKGEE